jgi:tight adherence protein B
MLPLGLFVVLSFISRGNDAYLKPLLETKAGHIMIGLGIFSQVVGFLIIQRIVSIDI